MALIKCKECGKTFSDSADVCPNCGYKKAIQGISSVESSRYIDQQLIPGEHLIYKCTIHWQIWIAPIIWTIFLGLIILGQLFANYVSGAILFLFILALIWLSAYMRFTGTDLAITNKRVICKFGFIWRKAFEINLDKIEGVVLKQSILGRIFDCASIIIRGTGSSSAPVPYIKDFREFKQKLLIECEKYKNTEHI